MPKTNQFKREIFCSVNMYALHFYAVYHIVIIGCYIAIVYRHFTISAYQCLHNVIDLQGHLMCDYSESHVTEVSMQASFHVFHFLFPLQWR